MVVLSKGGPLGQVSQEICVHFCFSNQQKKTHTPRDFESLRKEYIYGFSFDVLGRVLEVITGRSLDKARKIFQSCVGCDAFILPLKGGEGAKYAATVGKLHDLF